MTFIMYSTLSVYLTVFQYDTVLITQLICIYLHRWMSNCEPGGTLDNKQCAGAVGGHSGVQQRQSEATTQI